jgi:hypothetical protein
MIGLYTAIKEGRFVQAFSHVAVVLENELGGLQRFDAMEWSTTGFREKYEGAYVFRLKNLTDEHKTKIQAHCNSRLWSEYDKKGIFSFISKRVKENEMKDYCSELMKNALFFAWIIEDTEKITPYELYKLIREKVDFVGIIL